MNDDMIIGTAKKFSGNAQSTLGKAEDKILKITEEVCGAVNTASDNISEAATKVRKEIHESPVRSSFIALGIGFVIGSLFAR